MTAIRPEAYSGMGKAIREKGERKTGEETKELRTKGPQLNL